MHDQPAIEAFFANPDFPFTDGLILWTELKKQADKYKELEMMARKVIFKRTWPSWRVGVNNFPLQVGFVLKGTGKINYTVDKELFPQVREGLASMGGPSLDDFLRVSYSLAEGEYNKIVKDEQQDKTVGAVLRQMITSSEGAPTLEIVKSKKG